MARTSLSAIARHASLRAHSITSRRSFPTLQSRAHLNPAGFRGFQALSSVTRSASRSFSISATSFKGLSPESENPPPPKQTLESETLAATEISNEEYQELSESALDEIMEKLEDLQEKREDIDFESAAGVLNVTITGTGTWVINKQPPNKQIWLSSPISGPKRYDWVVLGEGQGEKEGSGSGDWIYLRDNSSLRELLSVEIGIDISKPLGS